MAAKENILGSLPDIFNADGNNAATTIKTNALASAWLTFATNCRYNSAISPVAGTADFTVPSATSIPGQIHTYLRYTPAGAVSNIYRFVPTTDSALTSLSYDSFWTTFSGGAGGTLSGLLAQRGQI